MIDSSSPIAHRPTALNISSVKIGADGGRSMLAARWRMDSGVGMAPVTRFPARAACHRPRSRRAQSPAERSGRLHFDARGGCTSVIGGGSSTAWHWKHRASPGMFSKPH